jgi:hypothetical protein
VKQRLALALAFTAATWLLAGIPACGIANAAQATLNIEVAPARWKAVRLKNLPKGATVELTVACTGTLDLIFMHRDELKRFPAAVSPLFQATVERKIEFSVVIPVSGDYYVILDNRRGKEAQKVRILIRAERPGPSNIRPPPPATPHKEEEQT